MNYLKRQYRIYKFTQLLKFILSDRSLATDRMQRDSYLEKVKCSYFSKIRPLENKNNKAVFPRATSQFIEAMGNGHTIDSMRKNLNDLLNSEFDSYFDDLIDKKVLISNHDNPLIYRLNHNSVMVYWILGIGVIMNFLWEMRRILDKSL